jgi:hypothetical protein
MEYLWDTLEKTPDGKGLRYNIYDVEMLWRMGFVDTKQFSMEEWRQVFEPYRQEDGTFLLSKDAFFALDKYRYKGEIHIPFDAMRINEGLYTDVGLNELVEASIEPSCSLSREELQKFFDDLKNEFRTPDNLIKIGPEAKMKIRDMINRNPSPLRNLEIMFDQMLAKGGEPELIEKVEGHEADIATARAALEASSFSASPASKTEAAASGLKKLAKAKKAVVEVETGAPSVSLKKIRRSRKGMRG